MDNLNFVLSSKYSMIVAALTKKVPCLINSEYLGVFSMVDINFYGTPKKYNLFIFISCSLIRLNKSHTDGPNPSVAMFFPSYFYKLFI